jgi:hypothetical protein
LNNFINYNGLKEIYSIVNDKRTIECNDPNSLINCLFGKLQANNLDLHWDNINYLSFPSYILSCLIGKEEFKGISHEFKLQITISLISDYYTIFCHDQFGFTDYKKELMFAAVYDIYSFETSKHKLPDSLLLMVKSEMNKIYPEKKFISHHIIMQTIVSGSLPFGKDISLYPISSYSIYDLLFQDFFNGDYKILE